MTIVLLLAFVASLSRQEAKADRNKDFRHDSAPLGVNVSDCGGAGHPPPLWLGKLKKDGSGPAADRDSLGHGGVPATAPAFTKGDLFVIPCGTKIRIALQDSIDSGALRARQPVVDYTKVERHFAHGALIDGPASLPAPPGEQVRAYTTEDIEVDGKIYIPARALICGHVTSISTSSLATNTYALGFDRLTLPNGKVIVISAVPLARGGLLRVLRAGEQIFLNSNIAGIETIGTGQQQFVQKDQPSWAALIRGTRHKSPDLQAGDEITIEAETDIRSDNVAPEK